MTRKISIFFKGIMSKSEKPKIIDWMLFLVICVVSYLCFSQSGDLTLTSMHSMTLIDAIVNGNFLHFYSYVTSLVPTGIYGGTNEFYNAFYSVVLYATFSIWNLPLWIYSKCTHTSVDFYVLMMWGKTLVLVCTLLSGFLVYKIGLAFKMTKNKAKWMMFIYLTSPILLFGSVIFGQYDIFGVVVTLLAILMLLNKKYYLFCIYMAFAISYKDFALMIFIPLVLLFEKRIFHIIKYYAIGVSVFLLQNIIFHFDSGYNITQKNGEKIFGFYSSLTSCGFPSGYGTASFIIITLMVLCVIAYKKVIQSNFELGQYVIYIPLVMYGVFFSSIGWHPQWLIILVPYLVMMAFISEDFKLTMFIDIAISMAFILISIIHYVNNVDQSMINNGIIPRIFHAYYDNSVTFAELATKFYLQMNLLVSIFVGGILLEIFMKFPSSKKLNSRIESYADVFMPERSVILIRALSILVYILPTFVLYFHFLAKLNS